MSAINTHHQEEISKFLKFFRARLGTHLENVDGDFEDTRSDRLSSDEVYSQKDVQDVLKSLNFAVKASVRSEQQDTINMMALLLRQIFVEAETKKLSLELDIGRVEDRELLEKVEKLSVSEWVDDDASGKARKRTGGPAAVSPAKLQQEQMLQMQKEHEHEIRQAKRTSELLQEEHAQELKQMQRKLYEAQDKVDELEHKLEDMQKHISQTKQFQAMKQEVAKKNSQLTELRRRLQRYEPDDGDEDDGKNADEDD